ncbi:hypothetical protein SLEP1_g19249 [Rubroshorea leprosula]|nr:hypothetical protein SLEP1_g19249 [Rubroshorea leprosula]
MNKNIFFAVVLDPSQKMRYLNCLPRDLYQEPEGKAKEYGCWIEAELRKLFEFYNAEIENQNKNCGSNSTNATSSSSGGQGPNRSNLNHPIRSKPSSENGVGGVASLKAYRNSNVSSYQSEPGNKKWVKDTKRFKDIYQRLKSGRFPILVAMARDILVIPVSTVASKSAFSTSGRVLDDFRSSLTPKMA